jgi:hypothetical protein
MQCGWDILKLHESYLLRALVSMEFQELFYNSFFCVDLVIQYGRVCFKKERLSLPQSRS